MIGLISLGIALKRRKLLLRKYSWDLEIAGAVLSPYLNLTVTVARVTGACNVTDLYAPTSLSYVVLNRRHKAVSKANTLHNIEFKAFTCISTTKRNKWVSVKATKEKGRKTPPRQLSDHHRKQGGPNYKECQLRTVILIFPNTGPGL